MVQPSCAGAYSADCVINAITIEKFRYPCGSKDAICLGNGARRQRLL